MSLNDWVDECQEKQSKHLLEFFYKETDRVYPPPSQVFHAFDFFKPQDCRVCILGQDPYHQNGQAHGLAFSVQKGCRLPPSLRNIFKELQQEYGGALRENGCLEDWSQQGVLLLNTVLSVREGEAGSHAQQGWEQWIQGVLETLLKKNQKVVFVLWGAFAKKMFTALIEERLGSRLGDYHWIECPHPSPLSAYRGFFGSNVFVRVNEILEKQGRDKIDWIGK